MTSLSFTKFWNIIATIWHDVCFISSMKQNELNELRSNVRKYIADGRLHDAFKLLRNSAEQAMQWEIADDVSAIAKNYAYMLSYLADGRTDPGRDDMYEAIVADAYRNLDALTRNVLLRVCPTLYYNTLRILQMRHVTVDSSSRALHDSLSGTPSIVEQITGTATAVDVRVQEAALTEFFNALWTAFPLRAGDMQAVEGLFNDDSVPRKVRLLAVTALTMGLLEFFDSTRLDLLMRIYLRDNEEMDVTSAALVGFVLGMLKYRERSLPSSTQALISALNDRPGWRDDFRTVFLELIRTRDTERITRTIRDDIMPSMMNLRPDIMEKMRTADLDPEKLEANPQWEEMLSRSGLDSKLRELSEMQMQGADVFMSTFSNLKSFPFFSEAANWFLPFDPERSELAGSGIPESLLSLIASLPFLCDSDKYSFALSLGTIPEAQRKIMLSQFQDQQAAMLEQMMSEQTNATVRDERRRALNRYIQNLYRFFNLFRRKGDFSNPFANGINLLRVDTLAHEAADAETVRLVAEFYLRTEAYDEALMAFRRLDEMAGPDGTVLQKIGYCHQKMGDIDAAIDSYQQAEIFAPDGQWLLGRLAACLRRKGEYTSAAAYYKRLVEARPEDVSLALRLGDTLTLAGDYEEALKQYYKVEFLDENGTRALRPIAWTLLMKGDIEGSRKYYKRVLSDSPTHADYLNMGHMALAAGEYREAMNLYTTSLNLQNNNIEAFIADMRSDSQLLANIGVSPRIVTMIIDKMLFTLD